LFKENQDYQVTIYEKNTSIDLVEGYGIQLSTNSIKLLNKIGFNTLEDETGLTLRKLIFIQLNQKKKYAI
jgi:salicylate hydroxylase